MYTSKTTQNDLLECIKEFIQSFYEAVASQPYVPLFGIQINEVTDSANTERLRSFCGIYLRENQEKGYLNTLTMIAQLAKN